MKQAGISACDFFWAMFLGSLIAVAVAGVLAGGVAYKRLESQVIDMSFGQEPLRKELPSLYQYQH